VTQSVDTDDAAGPPPSDGLSLVGETKGFLKAWQRVLLGTAEWVPAQVGQLRQQSRDLEARARAADVGGLAHHLQTCEHCFWNGEVDKAKLVHCLRNVSEVAWQWRQDLRTRSDVFTVEGQGQVSRDRLTIEQPTLLAPPSVEMFQSSPPPAPPAPPPPPPSAWPPVLATAAGFPGEASLETAAPGEPELLQAELSLGPADAIEPSWAKRSVLQRWFRAGAQRESDLAPAPASRPPRKKPLAFPSLADPVYAPDDVSDSDLPQASSREAPAQRRAGGFPWVSASLGVAAVAGAAVLVSTFGGTHPEVGATASALEPGSRANQARKSSAAALPRGVLDGLLTDAHGYGGIESPELADLLDGEATQLVDSGGACAPGAVGCELIRTAALSPSPSPTASRAGAAERGTWLEGLELPGIGVKDDPRVRQVFEFHTRNAVGREAFQDLLFRCSVYRDQVHAALERYGMPLELLALPMATSGCVADAESDDGGRGLWQLTTAAAKAYHLRVKAQVVDERIEPAKATDAGVRLLEDLHRKLGSWELALAAYQLGPLALIARLRDAGEDASYWALDDVGAMPAAATKHVPKVQAFALILANLAKFRFEPAPLQVPEVTAALEVPPGTRLGLVARAAASSTTRIRELNPDVLGDRVPDWPGERFVLRVPREGGERAPETLSLLIAASDHADECVPHAFDWGRQRFTRAMASRCEHASNR
jgi:hypothetical protein